jgi:hypothetical protein
MSRRQAILSAAVDEALNVLARAISVESIILSTLQDGRELHAILEQRFHEDPEEMAGAWAKCVTLVGGLERLAVHIRHERQEIERSTLAGGG